MSKNIEFTEMALKHNLFGGISSQIPKTQNLNKKWKAILRASFIKRQYRNFRCPPPALPDRVLSGSPRKLRFKSLRRLPGARRCPWGRGRALGPHPVDTAAV